MNHVCHSFIFYIESKVRVVLYWDIVCEKIFHIHSSALSFMLIKLPVRTLKNRQFLALRSDMTWHDMTPLARRHRILYCAILSKVKNEGAAQPPPLTTFELPIDNHNLLTFSIPTVRTLARTVFNIQYQERMNALKYSLWKGHP